MKVKLCQGITHVDTSITFWVYRKIYFYIMMAFNVFLEFDIFRKDIKDAKEALFLNDLE